MKKILLLLLTLTLVFTSALFVSSCNDDKHTHLLTFVEAVDATCTSDGNVAHYHCSGCDKNYSDENATTEIDDVVVNATGHDLSFVDAMDKTCTTNGNVAHYHCSECLKNYSDKNATTEIEDVIIKASHNFVDGICENCSQDYSNGLIFTLLDDNTYSVSKGSFDDTILIIPSTYNGKTVSTIEEGTFSGCSSLEEITIPFVGAVAGKTSSDTYQYPFGYIFGTSSYMGGVKTYQYYYGSSTSSTTHNYYYIPSSLKKVTVTGGNILYGAFYNCNNISTIVLADNVTSIGKYAFYGCYSITSLIIPDKVTSISSGTFSGCVKLIEVINKSSLDMTERDYYYGDGWYRVSLLYVHNGDSLIKTINDYQFITYDNVNYLLGYLGNDTEITLPSNYNGENYQIYEYAFYYNTKLTKVTIPDNVTSIGEGAFKHCRSLTSITIPDSVTSIGSEAFYDCNSLKYNTYDNAYYLGNDNNPYLLLVKATRTSISSCTINPNTKFVHSSAFNKCSLTSVTIPDSITSIGQYAFYNCISLENIYYTGDINSWVQISGLGNLPNVNLYINDTLSTNLTEVNITTATSISDCAFIGCTSLTKVTIGDQVTSIGNGAFYGCSLLTSITIPNSVTSIGEYAFEDCSSLTSVTFENTSGWYVTEDSSATSGTNVDVTDSSQNATYLKSTYYNYYWKRS